MKVITEIYDGLSLRYWFTEYGQYRHKGVYYTTKDKLVAQIDNLQEEIEASWQLIYEAIEHIHGEEFTIEVLSFYVSNFEDLLEKYLDTETIDESYSPDDDPSNMSVIAYNDHMELGESLDIYYVFDKAGDTYKAFNDFDDAYDFAQNLSGEEEFNFKFPEVVKDEPNLEGLSDGLTIRDIAILHNVSPAYIKTQLDKGIKVEMEHTKDKAVARQIAMDHLVELPDYYTKLNKHVEPSKKDKGE